MVRAWGAAVVNVGSGREVRREMLLVYGRTASRRPSELTSRCTVADVWLAERMSGRVTSPRVLGIRSHEASSDASDQL
jgi:hypothetical protein